MKVQELLELLTKAQNETDFNTEEVWAISKYLNEVWKDDPERVIRPYHLGKAMSDFFVDLSQQRLPKKVISQSPETERLLSEFFGTIEGGLPKFWTQCIAIWDVVLQYEPGFSQQVRDYFDMLLSSSMHSRLVGPPASPTEPSAAFGAETEEENPTESPVDPIVNDEYPPEPVEEIHAKEASETQQEPTSEDLAPQTEKPAGEEPSSGAVQPSSENEPESNMLPRNAYLILQGTRVIPLSQSFIKIGRQLDNDVILQDPRVSRSHAQIKLINDRFMIFDMHSTGGTFVNGKRSDQSVLFPGDVVSLAGVVFLYSQELPAKPSEVKVIHLGSKYAADRPTAVSHTEDENQAEKVYLTELPDLPRTGPLQQ